jgi:hypothetical protein
VPPRRSSYRRQMASRASAAPKGARMLTRSETSVTPGFISIVGFPRPCARTTGSAI